MMRVDSGAGEDRAAQAEDFRRADERSGVPGSEIPAKTMAGSPDSSSASGSLSVSGKTAINPGGVSTSEARASAWSGAT